MIRLRRHSGVPNGSGASPGGGGFGGSGGVCGGSAVLGVTGGLGLPGACPRPGPPGGFATPRPTTGGFTIGVAVGAVAEEPASTADATVPADAVDEGAVTADEGALVVAVAGVVGPGNGALSSGVALVPVPGSGPAGVGDNGPRFTAKKAMPPSAAAASSTAMSHTPIELLRRPPTSRGSMSDTESSAPKLSVFP